MAAYNSRRFIDSAIASIINQEFRDWELVVLDDGSTDGTAERIKFWGNSDPRIKCYQNATNHGLGPARRRLLSLASGKYSAVLDSDDVATKDWLQIRLAHLGAFPSVVALSG